MSSSRVINNRNLIYCDRWYKKLRGLYLRSRDCQCVLFSCNCIHTFFFFRNIDVAFLDSEKRVIKLARGVKSFRVLYCKGAKFAFERFANNEKDFLKLNNKIDF